MKMKLFYAWNRKQIHELEGVVNAFLDTVPSTSNVFFVSTAASAREIEGTSSAPALAITVWYG